VAKEDILAGLHEAIATRSLNLLKRISIEKDFTITGGIAKNSGMVARLKEKVGLEPLLCADPQLVGALGAALFASERYHGARIREMKIQYGYDDATGAYFITIDNALCDGCGQCVPACPAGILEIAPDEGKRPKARVKEALRKRLSIVCPGIKACQNSQVIECHSACPKHAINHSW
jgi:NAD-dependent dihydropyrimidine dehydrogenase PreA subunit